MISELDISGAAHLPIQQHWEMSCSKGRSRRTMAPQDTKGWEPQDLTAWRQRLQLTPNQAAEALGMNVRQIQDYEAEGGTIPLIVELACEALENRRKRESEMPVKRLEIGRKGLPRA